MPYRQECLRWQLIVAERKERKWRKLRDVHGP
jgi:hypothetical protein